MFTTAYVSTRDPRGHRHEYRQPLNEAVPQGHDIINLKMAGQFRLSEMLSDESTAALFIAQKNASGMRTHKPPKHGGALKLVSLSLTREGKRESKRVIE